MKITAIRCHLMQAGGPPHTGWTATGKSLLATARNWLFVTVHTEDGLTGTGEGSGWPRVVRTAVDDLAPLLIGDDARDIERLWQKMRVAMMGHGQTGVVGMGAIAAIDTALWDLKAQAAGMSVARLLGGLVRQQIPYYCHAASIDTARAAVAAGVRAIKVGGRGDVVARTFAMREALGDEIDLMVDLHGPPWSSGADAVAVGRALEAANLLFLEEPVAPDDLDGWRRVRDAVSIPLAGGERLASLADMRVLMEERLVDVLQPDSGRFGGLTQMRKLAGMAEAHGLSIAPHSGSLGPVAEFAAVHLMAAIPNALILERMEPDWAGRAETVSPPLEVSDGHVRVPDRPGLGLSLNEAFVASHPSDRNTGIATGGWNAGTESETLYLQPLRPRSVLTRRNPKP
ncbi:MAG: mandelate racemase/muconate lactonizing enzyme family protein [Rhizobacter sp.]|nr:mandelate racemase/muconate lactonizing enzyme family protein [Rhizobacter sp.]